MGTHYAGTPKEKRALGTYTKLLRAASSVKARIDRYQTAGELTDTQFGVLDMLWHLGPLNQKTIGQKLLVSKSNVVAVIDRLEQRGLVERRRSDEDRRCIFVHLTGTGRELIQGLFPSHVAAIVEELSCLTAAEQEELGRLCRKLGLNEQRRLR
ncbi:MAG: MarR family winged helix-turn-helix transcriptional regulator [Anaerolineales bacterium]